MRKKIIGIIVSVCVVAMFAIPSLAAREVEVFSFSAVTYAWGTGDQSATKYLIKDNVSTAAIVNTVKSQGTYPDGFVTNSNKFDTRLRMWDSGPSLLVGSLSAVTAYTRTEIPYSRTDVKSWGIRAEFSWNQAGTSAGTINGSWSPDAY